MSKTVVLGVIFQDSFLISNIIYYIVIRYRIENIKKSLWKKRQIRA